MTMMMGEMWTQLGSVIGGLTLVWAIFKQYFPYELRGTIERHIHKLVSFVSPYVDITFHEYAGKYFRRSEVYSTIETYLSANSSTRAKKLKADIVKDSQSLVLSMDHSEQVPDVFKGINVWWASSKISRPSSFSFYPSTDEKRFYTLTFHEQHREIITGPYLKHVMEEGKAVAVKNRQRKLYTNNRSEDWYGYKRSIWSHVVFEHPATFEILGMEPKKKEDIRNDLVAFSKAKDYYAKIGKAWKRGYLLYGPPGTGKSTTIAAMANLLGYDVYDLELTAVKDNTELKKLIIDTSSKSIIVIEDIDCSLDLTGQRKKQKDKDAEEAEEKDPISKKKNEEGKDTASKVTLSGLLNCIDGLWSACGGERIIVFTTNYVEKLDPALIRRGRMDMHIELSYCCFEAFKVLAKNYLDIEEHDLFATIRRLLEETNISPADVAENLMLKSDSKDAVEICLRNLIQALETSKEEARLKVEEEAKIKAEEEEKEKEAYAKKEDEKNSTPAKEVKENGSVIT